MKYTFVSEEQKLPYSETYSARKHTVEFEADDLTTLLSTFEDFLRGNGFLINGTIDVVPCDDDTFGNHEYNDDDVTINLGSMNEFFTFPQGGAQPTMDFGSMDDGITITSSSLHPQSFADGDTISISLPEETPAVCSVCKLTAKQMDGMHCFDSRCGLGKNKQESFYI